MNFNDQFKDIFLQSYRILTDHFRFHSSYRQKMTFYHNHFGLIGYILSLLFHESLNHRDGCQNHLFLFFASNPLTKPFHSILPLYLFIYSTGVKCIERCVMSPKNHVLIKKKKCLFLFRLLYIIAEDMMNCTQFQRNERFSLST